MARAFNVGMPSSYYPDFTRSRAVFNGKVYVGLVDTDPRQLSNRVTIYLQNEDGTEIEIPPSSQPVRLSAGGVLEYNGSPAIFALDDNFSMAVDSRDDNPIYWFKNYARANLGSITSDIGESLVGNPDTVADLKLLDLNVGDRISTKGFYSPGDGGAARYLVVADGTFTDGVDGHHDGYDYFQGAGFQIALSHGGVVFPEQFGWIGDSDGSAGSGTDNTAAINNMISYCSPYEFDTDILTTRANMGNVRAKIVGGFGIARVTDSVLINPFLRWEGLKKGGFFDQNNGTRIVADFDDNAKYCADTAPIIAGGARPLGATYTGADFDAGDTPGCPGWHITNVGFRAATGRTIKGAFNRQVAQQSKLEGCSLGAGGGDCYEGVKSSACWGGALTDNHIIARAYCIRNENDITIDEQRNNYLTISGTAPSPAVYTYITWPDASLQDKTACIANRFADPHMYSNTCEGAQIGLQSTGVPFNVRDNNNYYEKITEYVYGINNQNVHLNPKWIFCAGAELIHIDGSSVSPAKINLQGCAELTIDGWGFISSFVGSIYVEGATRAVALPHSSRVSFTDLDRLGIVNVYVNSTGDDTASGYLASQAVQTLQEALTRCVRGSKNVINLTAGQTITTKYSVAAGNVTGITFDGYDIEITGAATIAVGESFSQTHCIPVANSRVKLTGGITVDLSGGATGPYSSFLRTKGDTDFSLSNATVTGVGAPLLGSQVNAAGNARIDMTGVTFGNGVLFTTNSTAPKAFSWVENSVSITDNGLVEGSGTDGKIFSTLF